MGASKSKPVDKELEELKERLLQINPESKVYYNLSEEEKLALVKGSYTSKEAWAATGAIGLERLGLKPANAAALALALYPSKLPGL
jgi:hypothetical protein